MAVIEALKRGGLILAVAAGLAMPVSSGVAQESEQAFFAGKTVRFVVGFGAGGGYDAYARMLAPYLSKTLGATVIVENRPGAGGLLALNGVYIAPPDGLTMMIVNGTAAVYSQLTDLQGARYDLGKIGYLATLSAPPSLWTVSPHDKTKTIAQALTATRKWRWAASGPVDSLSDGAAFTCAGLKLDCQIVLGYKGSNDAALAVARGEMDALYVTDTSANTYVQSNGLVPLATIGQKRSRFFPELPTIFEAAKLNPEQEWIFNFRHLAQSLGRILVAPPGMSESRLAFLEAAVKKASSDPSFLAEGDKRQLYTDYVDAAGTRKNATSIVTTVTPEQRKLVQDILAERGDGSRTRRLQGRLSSAPCAGCALRHSRDARRLAISGRSRRSARQTRCASVNMSRSLTGMTLRFGSPLMPARPESEMAPTPMPCMTAATTPSRLEVSRTGWMLISASFSARSNAPPVR